MSPEGPGGTPTAPAPTVTDPTDAQILAALRLAVYNNMTGGGPLSYSFNGQKTEFRDLDAMQRAIKYYKSEVANEAAGGGVTFAGLSQQP